MDAMRLCPACKHYREPLRVTAFAPGTAHSAGQRRAVTQGIGNAAKLRAVEQQRVQGRVPLDYPPGFFPWCERFTADETLTTAVRDALLAGDSGPYSRAQEQGYQFVVDFANGTVKPVYALCMRKNPDGRCGAFTAGQHREVLG